MTKPNVIAPTIHLNGTSGADLIDQNREVFDALQIVLKKMREATPHGRDYYVQGPEAYATARREFEARYAQVQLVADTYEEILIQVLDQQNEREARKR